MRDTRKSAVTLAGAGTLAVLLATSAFAANTPRDAQSREARNGRQPAAARNDTTRNQAQTAPRVQQSQNFARNNGSQPATAQFQRPVPAQPAAFQANRGTFQGTRGYDATRNVAASGNNGNWSASGRGSAQVSNRTSRDNGRVNLQGRVSSFTHEGNGYRVHLDRDGRSFWIPESRLGNHGRDLRVGLSLSLGGIFRGGLIDVDAITWPGSYGYAPVIAQGLVSGVVEQVDYRTDTILLRDDASGTVFNVDMRAAGATSRIDARNLRPGDYLTLSGQWDRGGLFEAYRVDSLNNTRTF